MTVVVDSHHHFWKLTAQEQPWRTPEHAAIAADYGPEDLAGPLENARIDSTVLVQSVNGPQENDRLGRYASVAPFVAGVVGWLPVTEPERANEELRRLRRHPWLWSRMCGVRFLPGHDPLEDLADPRVVALFDSLAENGLSWDAVAVTAEQRAAVVRLAREVPELHIVVDHLARPPVDTLMWQPWASQIESLAMCPNVAIKVSVGLDVLSSWKSWNSAGLARYVHHVLRCFGSSRVMLGSNWPVVLLRAEYQQAWQELRACVLADTPGNDADPLGGTATRWYRLP